MIEVKSYLTGFDANTFSVLHLNIRSTKRNFKNFKEFLKKSSVNISATSLSKTRCESKEQLWKSYDIISDYDCFPGYTKYCRGGGVCISL